MLKEPTFLQISVAATGDRQSSGTKRALTPLINAILSLLNEEQVWITYNAKAHP